MIFAFCTLGDMNFKEVKRECADNKFVPILVYVYEGKRVMPYFSSGNVCKDFCRRNLPKEWLSGAVTLGQEELEKLAADNNMDVKLFDWPRNIKKFVEWDIIIHEFLDTPDISAKAIR